MCDVFQKLPLYVTFIQEGTGMTEHYKVNPDDRSDNAGKLQEMVQNTIDNIHDAKAAIPHSNEQDCAAIEAKNERRMESIEKMKAEIKEEASYRR